MAYLSAIREIANNIYPFLSSDPLDDYSEPETPYEDNSTPESFMQLTVRHYDTRFVRIMTLVNVMWIILGLLTITYVIHNTVKYLVRQGRYKEFHITFFYSLTLLTLSLRLYQFATTIGYYHGWGGNSLRYKISGVSILATFLEGMLGIQQLCALIDVELMVRFSQLTTDGSLERFELKIEQESITHQSKRTKWLTVLFSLLSITVYCLYITSRYTSRDASMQFWTACFGVISELVIGALLVYKSQQLKNISKKQFGRRLIPQKVRHIIGFTSFFAAAFIFQAIVTVLGLSRTLNNYFYPDRWHVLQIVVFTITYMIYDIVAITVLLHLHHMHFKACSLESLKDFKNTCLLGESFLREDEKYDLTSDIESEPDIDNHQLGGKFKSVLLDVNRQTNKSMTKGTTFDTSNMKEYYGTEVAESLDISHPYDDLQDLSLSRYDSKGMPGTQQNDSPPHHSIDIDY